MAIHKALDRGEVISLTKPNIFLLLVLRVREIDLYEALGNNCRGCGVYFQEPRVEVYCVRLNFNISKSIYSHAHHRSVV